MSRPALLALEDGSLFHGIGFGHLSHIATFSVGEVVFNTSMTGYQEILTDPSYSGQMIVLTYPQIGNVGVNLDDNESNQIYAQGLIIRQLPKMVSNYRRQSDLEQMLAQHKILGIAEIDTRRLTRLLREKGAMRGCIYSAPHIDPTQHQEAIVLARQCAPLNGCDLAQKVSTAVPYVWQEGALWPKITRKNANTDFHVVAYDFGIKKTILRCLTALACKVTVVNAKTPAADVIKMNPDGVFLSNGPGDPEPCDYAIKNIQTLMSKDIPLFGICLGHQLLGLALGAKTVKMKFGHHGGNHPVQSLIDKQVLITSQNHGFAIEDNNLPNTVQVTHRSLFDNTIQGIKHSQKPCFGFQGHPEAGPGPNDARVIFQPFIQAMQVYKRTKQPTRELEAQ